jgi:hypothetical protein
MKNLDKNNRCSNRHSNQAPLEQHKMASLELTSSMLGDITSLNMKVTLVSDITTHSMLEVY